MISEEIILQHIPAEYAETAAFKTAYGIYILCELYKEAPLSLPQFSYTLNSLLSEISIPTSSGKHMLPFSPLQCRQKLLRLAALYDADTFENPYIVERTMQIILSTQENVTLSVLSDALSLSPAYISSAISRSTGVPLRNILFCHRLISFVSIVCSAPNATLESISYRIGYKSIHQFSKSFHRNTGVAPSILKRDILLISEVIRLCKSSLPEV